MGASGSYCCGVQDWCIRHGHLAILIEYSILQGKTEFSGPGWQYVVCLQQLLIGITDRKKSGHSHIGVVVCQTGGMVMIPDGAGLLIHRVVVGPFRAMLPGGFPERAPLNETGREPGMDHAVALRADMGAVDMGYNAVVGETIRRYRSADGRVEAGRLFIDQVVQPLHTDRAPLGAFNGWSRPVPDTV